MYTNGFNNKVNPQKSVNWGAHNSMDLGLVKLPMYDENFWIQVCLSGIWKTGVHSGLRAQDDYIFLQEGKLIW